MKKILTLRCSGDKICINLIAKTMTRLARNTKKRALAAEKTQEWEI